MYLCPNANFYTSLKCNCTSCFLLSSWIKKYILHVSQLQMSENRSFDGTQLLNTQVCCVSIVEWI